MSQIAMPTPQRPSNLKFTSRRPTATAAAANSRSSLSDDEITPCSSPAPEPQEPLVSSSPQHRASPSSSSSSRKTTATTTNTSQWHFDPADGEDMDDSQLWQRMLDIQRTFHCYNSARMSAALLELEMGVDVWRLAPSRSCLDLMNESVCDLSGEDRQRLEEWLHENPSKRKRSGIWRRSINF